MGLDPESAVQMRQFLGMASNVDPRDLKPGVSQVQINVAVIRPGELVVRRGLRELTFDSDDS